MSRLFLCPVIAWLAAAGQCVAAEVTEIRGTVELRDGSRLVGRIPVLQIPFHEDGGELSRISTARIVEISVDADGEIARLQLGNRMLRGVVELEKLPIRGLFGRVKIDFAHIAKVSFVQPSLGLIAHYRFDGNCKDASGNGNHGKPHDNVVFARGRAGQAAVFDGAGDYISIDPKSDVANIRDFTISAWVYVQRWKPYPRGFQYDRQYVFDGYSQPAKRRFNSNGFALICFGPNAHRTQCYTSVDRRNYISRQAPVPLTRNWRMLTFCRRGKQQVVYVDGRPVKSHVSGAGNTDRPLNMKHRWFVGTFAGNDPNYPSRGLRYDFHGLIDDLRIYSRALSDLEVRELAGR